MGNFLKISNWKIHDFKRLKFQASGFPSELKKGFFMLLVDGL